MDELKVKLKYQKYYIQNVELSELILISWTYYNWQSADSFKFIICFI